MNYSPNHALVLKKYSWRCPKHSPRVSKQLRSEDNTAPSPWAQPLLFCSLEEPFCLPLWKVFPDQLSSLSPFNITISLPGSHPHPRYTHLHMLLAHTATHVPASVSNKQTHPYKYVPKHPHGPPKKLSEVAESTSFAGFPVWSDHSHLAFSTESSSISSLNCSISESMGVHWFLRSCSGFTLVRLEPVGSFVKCSLLKSILNRWEGYLRLNTTSPEWKILHYNMTDCFVTYS